MEVDDQRTLLAMFNKNEANFWGTIKESHTDKRLVVTCITLHYNSISACRARRISLRMFRLWVIGATKNGKCDLKTSGNLFRRRQVAQGKKTPRNMTWLWMGHLIPKIVWGTLFWLAGRPCIVDAGPCATRASGLILDVQYVHCGCLLFPFSAWYTGKIFFWEPNDFYTMGQDAEFKPVYNANDQFALHALLSNSNGGPYLVGLAKTAISV